VDVLAGIGSDRPYDWGAGVGLRFNYWNRYGCNAGGIRVTDIAPRVTEFGCYPELCFAELYCKINVF
jgi:hypothetical protein